jgi:hypothetical protein
VRVIDRTTEPIYVQAGGDRGCAQLVRGCETCVPPKGVAQPSANAPGSRPRAPSTEFAYDKAAAGFEHARHFLDSAGSLFHEAKNRYGSHHIKALITERKMLGAAEQIAHRVPLGHCPRGRLRHHVRVRVAADDE